MCGLYTLGVHGSLLVGSTLSGSNYLPPLSLSPSSHLQKLHGPTAQDYRYVTFPVRELGGVVSSAGWRLHLVGCFCCFSCSSGHFGLTHGTHKAAYVTTRVASAHKWDQSATELFVVVM